MKTPALCGGLSRSLLECEAGRSVLVEEGHSTERILLDLVHSLTLDSHLVSDLLKGPSFETGQEL